MRVSGLAGRFMRPSQTASYINGKQGWKSIAGMLRGRIVLIKNTKCHLLTKYYDFSKVYIF